MLFWYVYRVNINFQLVKSGLILQTDILNFISVELCCLFFGFQIAGSVASRSDIGCDVMSKITAKITRVLMTRELDAKWVHLCGWWYVHVLVLIWLVLKNRQKTESPGRTSSMTSNAATLVYAHFSCHSSSVWPQYNSK